MILIFDLDGTLVDSAPDIRAAVNLMLAGEGLGPLDLPTVTGFVGNGMPKLVERVMAAKGIDPARHKALTQVTLDHYNAAPSALTRPRRWNASRRLAAGRRCSSATARWMPKPLQRRGCPFTCLPKATGNPRSPPCRTGRVFRTSRRFPA